MKGLLPNLSYKLSWMLTSKRLARLGSGVFDRNDQRKRSYNLDSSRQQQPLIDLSLGCTDLLPPPDAIKAMGNHLEEPWRPKFLREGERDVEVQQLLAGVV